MAVQQRETIAIQLWGGQIIHSRRLFEPETNDLAGKPLDKPRYSCNVRFPKTRANWFEEPALHPLMEACRTIMTREMNGIPFPSIEFPVKDGDRPNKKGKTPDYGKGHWLVKMDSTFPPKVEQMHQGSAPQEIGSLSLGGRRLWGDGDHVAVSISIAKRTTDMVGIKSYLNSVCFTKKGVELNTGGAAPVDWQAAAALAAQQGIDLHIDNNPAPGSFGGAPGQSGFPGADQNPNGFSTGPGPQQGFGQAGFGAPGMQQPGGQAGFGQQGFQPQQQGGQAGFQPGFGQGFQPQGQPQQNGFQPGFGQQGFAPQGQPSGFPGGQQGFAPQGQPGGFPGRDPDVPF